MKILQVLLACVQCNAGLLLTEGINPPSGLLTSPSLLPFLALFNCHTADVIFEMVQTCFRMTVQTRLSELLRRCAESTLVEMVIYIFSNYNMQNPPGMFYFIFKSITSIILFVIILYYHSSLTSFFFLFLFLSELTTSSNIPHSTSPTPESDININENPNNTQEPLPPSGPPSLQSSTSGIEGPATVILPAVFPPPSPLLSTVMLMAN